MRRGISMIEVLVSLFVIAILMAILLPAVQRSREAARLAQCKSHLHQLGVACSSFETSHKVLPCGPTAFTNLLPYLEGGDGVVSPLVMVCPSDPMTRRAFGEVNFHLNSGSRFWDTNLDYDGILVRSVLRIRGRPLRDISDGLSNTALFSERLSASSFVDQLSVSQLAADPTRYLWYIREPVWNSGREDELVRRCKQERTGQFPPSLGTSSLFAVWYPGYNHLTTPNHPPCFNGNLEEVSINTPVVPPTSLHIGGVSLLLCDGSTRFVSNSVDEVLWRSVGTRNDGNVIPNEW